MRRERKKKELALGEVLVERWLTKLGFDPAVYPVFALWDRLTGWPPEKARAVALKKSVLYVEVDSSARRHDLYLKRRKLIQELNGAFGRPVVSDIIIRLQSAPHSVEKSGDL